MSNQDNPYGGTNAQGQYQMSVQSGAGAPAGGREGSGEIKDISTNEFVSEVIEASKNIPVLIDFWAPWCGPCKQLTPILEKVAGEFAGRVKLVKMNTEQYPEIPGQMGIQSIPAVVAFVDGKPADAFMGVQPESEVRKFFKKHAGADESEMIAKILGDARELISQGDLSAAADLLTAFVQSSPQNPEAQALLGIVYLKNGDLEQAEALYQSIGEDGRETSDGIALKAELELAQQINGLEDIQQLIDNVENNSGDLQAKFDLSLAYNSQNRREEAVDQLIDIIKQSRDWNDDGARKQLITYFEAWGPTDEASVAGRRKLSTVLFS